MLFIWVWSFLLFFFKKAELLKTCCLVLPRAWGKARATQGCRSLAGSSASSVPASPSAGDVHQPKAFPYGTGWGVRNAASTGTWGCIAVSVDFREEYFCVAPRPA